MKKLLLCISILYCFAASAQEPVRVLFIGNSFTYTNNLPAILQNLAQSQGKKVSTHANLIGEMGFKGHAQNDSTNKLIRQGNYDYVVLQGYSREFTHSDDSIEQASLPYVQQLMDSIQHYAPQAIPIFYMTWGYKNGTTLPTSFANFDDMNNIIQQRYENLAQYYVCWVAPVGVAWKTIIHTYPNINLYASDNYHPSLAGSYLAACTFYSMLFNERCNSQYYAGLPGQQAVILQKAASTTVKQSLYKWKYIHNDVLFDDNLLELYPNPAVDSVRFNPRSEYATISIISLLGKEVVRFENAKTPFSISISEFADGVYFVKMLYNSTVLTKRLIIKKR
ncbi:MAG: DUF4886 domain-containing protein [Bacteroidales bacterium]|jgi:hypothetical protein|nr:DUF4886 domain-containing protein [Bacteroidales bacterium]